MAIYDAMFGDAWGQYLEHTKSRFQSLPQEPRAGLRRMALDFFDFNVADPARFQLMNQRVIPGFVPSPEAYAPSVEVMETFRGFMAGLGLRKQADIDLCVAIVGVSSRHSSPMTQVAPGGDVWCPAPWTCTPTRSACDHTSAPHPRRRSHDPHRRLAEHSSTSPAIDHKTAMRLAATEYGRDRRRVGRPLRRGLGPSDRLPRVDGRASSSLTSTAWPAWLRRPWRCSASRRLQRAWVEGSTHSLRTRSTSSARSRRADLVDGMRRLAPRAAKGRRRVPAFVRARTLPEQQVVDGVEEAWTIGFVIDVILTRDPWMHRIDLARATGREMTLTADHDGVIVDDVVREWAGRHGQAYRLELTGPAGGAWSAGQDGAAVEMDAVDFCRTLSGRDEGVGLLATQVPF